jgi:hypothetical protein
MVELLTLLNAFLNQLINSHRSSRVDHGGSIIVLGILGDNSLISCYIVSFLWVETHRQSFDINDTLPIMLCCCSIKDTASKIWMIIFLYGDAERSIYPIFPDLSANTILIGAEFQFFI